MGEQDQNVVPRSIVPWGLGRDVRHPKRLAPLAERATSDDYAVIRGMRLRGDPVYEIAKWWDTSTATISDVCLGRSPKYRVPAAPLSRLPPPPPYRVVSADVYTHLEQAAAVPAGVLRDLEATLANLAKATDALASKVSTLEASRGQPEGSVQALHSDRGGRPVPNDGESGEAPQGSGRSDTDARQLSFVW